MSRILALIVSLLLFVASIAKAEPIAIEPSQTDPAITHADFPHFAWTPTASARGQLVLFLPGTGGKPRENFRFAEVAASLGYHVVSLMYPDGLAAQKAEGESSDPGAYMKYCLAIIRGGRIPRPHGVKVIDPADGIDNRLDKLLLYLSARYPDQGWGQFLDADGRPRWDKLVVSGSSQGGGHAYMLGKLHKVARVLLFASPKDYSFHFDRPANGFDADTRTPMDRFFAFNHLRDDAHGCTHEQQARVLEQMKLTDLGIGNVDGQATPYGHAHVLYTNANVPDDRFHGAVIKRDFSSVWTYMLTEPAP